MAAAGLAAGGQQRRGRGLYFLTLAVALVGFAMSIQMAVNANFVADTMGLSGQQQGMLESARESCGIVALGVLAVLAGMSEPRIAVLMLVLLSAGLAMYARVGSFGGLILASLVWSQGLHVWMPLPNAMALALAEEGRTGRALGRLGAAGAVGSAGAIVLAWVMDRCGVSIRPMWLLAATAAFLAAGCCAGIPRDIKAPRARLTLRRKYLLYYLLCFLEGWRKQIFIAFAGYMLVKEHGTPLATMLLLFLVTQCIGWFSAPLTGRLIDRVGEKKVLLFYYSTMAAVFVAYALVRDARALYVLFVADNVLFVCTMAQTTYVSRIAPPEEHTTTLSAGVAANHIASVSMPLLGGFLWARFGYQWAFAAGAVMALLTLVPVALMPRREA